MVRDKIKVNVYYPHVHTVVVTQGHSLFAPNATPIIEVTPVTTSNGRYNVHVSGAYNLVVVSTDPSAVRGRRGRAATCRAAATISWIPTAA